MEFTIPTLERDATDDIPWVAHMGGSFNPVHDGHVAIVRMLLDRYGFDRVVVRPTSQHYAKSGLADDRSRLALLKAAFAGMDGVIVDEGELFATQPTRTLAALQHLTEQLHQTLGDHRLFTVRGADAARVAARWKSLDAILDIAVMVVVDRDGAVLESDVAPGTTLRRRHDRLRRVPGDGIPDVTSTQVRRALLSGSPADALVPPTVMEKIEQLGMYGTAAPGDAWITLYRPGYAGKGGRRRDRERSDTYGSDVWRTAFKWGHVVIAYRDALALYEDAYFAHLAGDAETLDWLLGAAREVYDNSETNILSGLDYEIQEAISTHLQDIAVRRVVMRLGQRFVGDQLIEIRGRTSSGFRLNPGQVPFHRPERIVRPVPQSWWQDDSVEAFWQANKVFQVRERAFTAGRPLVVHVLCPSMAGGVLCKSSAAGVELPSHCFAIAAGFAADIGRARSQLGLHVDALVPTLAEPVVADGSVHVLWTSREPGNAVGDLDSVKLATLRSGRLASPVAKLVRRAGRAGELAHLVP